MRASALRGQGPRFYLALLILFAASVFFFINTLSVSFEKCTFIASRSDHATKRIGCKSLTKTTEKGIRWFVHHSAIGQRMFAAARAWRVLIDAFVDSRGLRPLPNRAAEFLAPTADPRPQCDVHLVVDPRPNFPPGANGGFIAGAVVVRLLIDESGRVFDSQVAASAPERGFRSAVEAVAPRWHIERSPDSQPNCRFRPIMFVPVKFYFN
ncbi:MAG: energy transducer TonB [Hyphomonadaceae bacterium]